MLVILSWPRTVQLMKELEGLDPQTSDDEIAVRLDAYARRLFDHVRQFGVSVGNLAAPATSTVATFNCDISGCLDFQQQIDWDKLIGGLSFLRPIAVTVQPIDMEYICDGLVATAMVDRWNEYGHNLARLTVEELRPTIEAWLTEIVWKAQPTTQTEPLTPDEEIVREMELQDQFARAGVQDPLQKYKAITDFKQREEDMYRRLREAETNLKYNQFSR